MLLKFLLLLGVLSLLGWWTRRSELRSGSSAGSEREAANILGLEDGASREEIIAAHRRLIRSVHPDRGGSDYLARQINNARDLLLSRLG